MSSRRPPWLEKGYWTPERRERARLRAREQARERAEQGYWTPERREEARQRARKSWTPDRRAAARERASWQWHTLDPVEQHRRTVAAMDRSVEAAVAAQVRQRDWLRQELEEKV